VCTTHTVASRLKCSCDHDQTPIDAAAGSVSPRESSSTLRSSHVTLAVKHNDVRNRPGAARNAFAHTDTPSTHTTLVTPGRRRSGASEKYESHDSRTQQNNSLVPIVSMRWQGRMLLCAKSGRDFINFAHNGGLNSIRMCTLWRRMAPGGIGLVCAPALRTKH
jgi:hypothetical protein